MLSIPACFTRCKPSSDCAEGEQFTGLDGKVRIAEYDRYGPVPYWDTGRDQVVLLTLLERM